MQPHVFFVVRTEEKHLSALALSRYSATKLIIQTWYGSCMHVVVNVVDEAGHVPSMGAYKDYARRSLTRVDCTGYHYNYALYFYMYICILWTKFKEN